MGVRIQPKRAGVQGQREDHERTPIAEIFAFTIFNPHEPLAIVTSLDCRPGDEAVIFICPAVTVD
jgi:hypothetical protein